MIDAVLDTNVLVSGFPARTGAPSWLIDEWRLGVFRLVVSEPILEELAEAWRDRYWQSRFAPEDSAAAIALLRAAATITPVTIHVTGIATHPEDDVILATAVSGGVAVLVTGDRRLRDLGRFRGVSVLTPREFQEQLLATQAALAQDHPGESGAK